MGDPSKIRRKYSGPRHPWEGDRIDKERSLIKTYGLKNKKEIWRMDSLLKSFKDQVKKLSSMEGEQAEKEKEQLANRLSALGIMQKGTPLDSVLGLTVESVMDRRLQSRVNQLGLAKTAKQARQFIVHEHITVNGKKVSSPSYLVREGDNIDFSDGSALSDEMHPERVEEKPSSQKVEKKGEKTEDKIEEAKEQSLSKDKEQDADSEAASKDDSKESDKEEKGDDTKKEDKGEEASKNDSEEGEKVSDEESTADEGSSGKEELPETESSIRKLTKDDMKEYAEEEYGIELSTNNLKDEMVENFLEGLRNNG